MRELSKTEIQEVTGGAGFFDDLFGDGLIGQIISMGADLYDGVVEVAREPIGCRDCPGCNYSGC